MRENKEEEGKQEEKKEEEEKDEVGEKEEEERESDLWVGSNWWVVSCTALFFGPSERIKNKSQPYFTSESLKLLRKSKMHTVKATLHTSEYRGPHVAGGKWLGCSYPNYQSSHLKHLKKELGSVQKCFTGAMFLGLQMD